MDSSWMTTLGNWNPQFLRECRGRLTSRSVGAALGLSGLVQILLLLYVWQFRESLDLYTLPLMGETVFTVLTWVLPYGLFTVGSYYLITDLVQEERRGTLNFIRLSPRSGQTILLGKLLGVPILPYLMLGTIMPLHILSGLLARAPLGLFVSYYLLLLAGCGFMFSAALLSAFLAGKQTISGGQQSPIALTFSAFTFAFATPAFMLWNRYTIWSHFNIHPFLDNAPANLEFVRHLEWWFIPFTRHLLTGHAFTLLFLGLGSLLIWKILKRRFQQPTATILSKRQSYALTAFLEVLLLGFFLNSTIMTSADAMRGGLFFLGGFTFFWVVGILINGLSPSRLAVVDWLRFEQSQQAKLQDWIWADKTPAPVAIGFNLLIAAALQIPWILVCWPADAQPMQGILMVVSTSVASLIFATLLQMILISKLRRPWMWAGGTLCLGIFLPPILLAIFQIEAPVLWTFVGVPWIAFAEDVGSSPLLIGLLGQGLILGMLSWQLRLQLRRMARLSK
ncbi:MAG: hypothetical protein HC921_06125 [Synechococcaceae cyanobacterium SM2_3_1]|nr:hypothetical protein [Synechococcaceae cyanobacterium SM2_3_1]